MTLSCSVRYNESVSAQELVPENLPTRMLGWEQMILMFSHKPSSEVMMIESCKLTCLNSLSTYYLSHYNIELNDNWVSEW